MPKRAPRKQRVWFGIWAVVVLIVLAGGIAFYLADGTDGQHSSQTTRSSSKKLPTASTQRGGADKNPCPSPFTLDRGPTNKIVLTKNVPPPPLLNSNYYTCMSGGKPTFARPVFTNDAENILGGVLSAQPGTRFAPIEMGKDYDESFAESLKHPIVVDPDDTPDEVLIKEAVIKAKEQIVEMMKQGQKPSEIINDMHAEMNKIADYRDLMEEDFQKIKENGTAHDIKTYLKEANELLTEFGVPDKIMIFDDELGEINERLGQGTGGELLTPDDVNGQKKSEPINTEGTTK